ncbi:MAG: hypothetical protein OSA93_00395 [Akkermansiaceae bacterium]|nr:hypothetical protein [Akkermansiaceae bacterium]
MQFLSRRRKVVRFLADGLATHIFRCPWPIQDPCGKRLLRLTLLSGN